MKALAIIAACLVAASPAFAVPGAASHAGPAPHPGPSHGHGPGMMSGKHGHNGHGHDGYGGGNVFFDPFGPQVLSTFPAYTDVQPAVADLPPPVVLPAPDFVPPAPYCPPLEPARLRHTGPRIIYIGHQPKVSGPTVIYGTD
jgi:hypothetical protein